MKCPSEAASKGLLFPHRWTPGTMRYDRNGFPIPPDFESPRRRGDEWTESGGTTRVPEVPRDRPATRNGDAPAPRRDWRGGKSTLIVLVLALWIIPALVGPAILPLVRPLVVQWSKERSLQFLADDDVESALVELDRAIDWVEEDDPALLCQRAWLKLHGGNPGGAVEDACRAELLKPGIGKWMPLRVRGLAEVMRGNADRALADARLVVERSAPRDPAALNHRAYVRALVGRELPEALADIDAAIDSAGPAVTGGILDTRGFILHLLGRDEEALEQMEEAIGSMLEERRRVRRGAGLGHVDQLEAKLDLRTIEHDLAVMYQHRGLIHRQQGRDDLARQDFAAATAKGYDPARGVF